MSGKEIRFSLSDGYCHILPSYLVITQDGNVTEILRRKDKNFFELYRLVFIGSASAFLIFGCWLLYIGKVADSIYLFVCTVFNFYFLFAWRNRSNIKVIERSQIRNIRLAKVLFNPTFIILFKDKNGKMKERMLPMDSKKPQQISDAITILCNEKLMRPELQPDFKKVIQEIKTEKSNNKSEDFDAKKTEYKKGETSKPKRDSGGYIKDY